MRTLLAATLLLTSFTFAEPKPLIVHEWGTFTSLQDEQGNAVGGVNIDDEPLPKFVHRLGAQSGIWDGSKSIYPGSPSVTMRLETPVIYFYPPDNKPMTLDVTATFNGGILSEFYPNGETTLDGKPSRRSPERVKADTRGTLAWKNVTINTATTLPSTDAHVWLAPRNVAAAPISVGKEGEKYLFYRGVGHLDAPLRVARTAGGDMITIYDNRASDRRLTPLALGAMWLADFRADGSAAFRVITDQPADGKVKAKAISAAFAPEEYSSDNVAKLRAGMKEALISDGLFADEAEAMLETWKLSYFKSSGQRLFFLVPRPWTDSVLPLTLSQPAQITRVMMARIELVTPQQRLTAGQVYEAYQKKDNATAERLTGTLGRFATTLVNDEYRRRAIAATQPVARASAAN